MKERSGMVLVGKSCGGLGKKKSEDEGKKGRKS
jgi:hypothetical protein